MTRDFNDISGPDMAVWCEMLADDNAHVDARYSGNVFEGDDLTARILTEGATTDTRLTRGDDVLVSATFTFRKDRP